MVVELFMCSQMHLVTKMQRNSQDRMTTLLKFCRRKATSVSLWANDLFIPSRLTPMLSRFCNWLRASFVITSILEHDRDVTDSKSESDGIWHFFQNPTDT